MASFQGEEERLCCLPNIEFDDQGKRKVIRKLLLSDRQAHRQTDRRSAKQLKKTIRMCRSAS